MFYIILLTCLFYIGFDMLNVYIELYNTISCNSRCMIYFHLIIIFVLIVMFLILCTVSIKCIIIVSDVIVFVLLSRACDQYIFLKLSNGICKRVIILHDVQCVHIRYVNSGINVHSRLYDTQKVQDQCNFLDNNTNGSVFDVS